MTATLICTCVCGRSREPQPVDMAGWSVLAAAQDIAADGWGHDARGRRLCPDCREKAGIAAETTRMQELMS